MTRLSTAVFILIAIGMTGCPGGGDDDIPILIDAAVDAPDGGGGGCDGSSCNEACVPWAPAGQQGCDPGEKCTWEVVQETPEPLGRTTCVPDGTLAAGAACTAATVGAPDDCAAGLICVGGTCHEICGFGTSADEVCPSGENCTNYAGLFANGNDEPIAGACNPSCDPLAQLAAGGNPCPAGDGCYLLTSQTNTIAVCAGAGDIGHGVAITGTAYANSCVPGAQPRRRDGTSMTVECGGLCRPADVTTTTNMTSEGGVAPDSCANRWGAAPPADGIAGESCRYWWARESFEGLSPFSNSVGWCFKHAAFQYDTNGDMTPDAPFPRCTTLTTGDVVPPIGNPPHNDAMYFWCAALPATLTGGFTGKSAAPPVLRLDRLRR